MAILPGEGAGELKDGILRLADLSCSLGLLLMKGIAFGEGLKRYGEVTVGLYLGTNVWGIIGGSLRRMLLGYRALSSLEVGGEDFSLGQKFPRLIVPVGVLGFGAGAGAAFSASWGGEWNSIDDGVLGRDSLCGGGVVDIDCPSGVSVDPAIATLASLL